ncbi:MAG: NAD-dependent epimerase/dehydratase family protein [Huintestinicola sp.]
MNTAVITGPTGAIGTALCTKLISEGVKVYAVCRRDSARTDRIPKGAELVFCDLDRLSELKEKIGHTDVFYHFAWANTAGPGRNDMYSQTDNIKYTLDAVKAAKALGCECFIGAGSQAEYGRHNELLTPETPCFPENGYGMAKLCAGQMSRHMCSELGMRHIWARILSVYGPYDGENSMISFVIRTLLNGDEPSLTAGEQMWDYLFSYDAADALYLMWQKGRDGGVYPLGSGKVRPLREYIEILRDSIDPQLPLGLGKNPYGTNQVMYLGADISTLEKELGFKPAYSFESGIKLTIDSIKKATGNKK